MVAHIYSCLLTGNIPVQIRTGITTWNGTGMFMNIQAFSCSWNFRKAESVVEKAMVRNRYNPIPHPARAESQEASFFLADASKSNNPLNLTIH